MVIKKWVIVDISTEKFCYIYEPALTDKLELRGSLELKDNISLATMFDTKDLARLFQVGLSKPRKARDPRNDRFIDEPGLSSTVVKSYTVTLGDE